MNQQQSSNTAKKDIILQLLQSSVLKQRNLNDKISHEEISRLIDDIISLSEDNTGELRRSKRNLPSLLLPVFMLGVQTVALGSLGLALGASDFALIMYRVLSTQRGREIVMDLIDKALEGKDIMDTIEDLRRTRLFKTNEEQFTEVPQTTERQQVTEILQTTERQQVTTEGQQVTGVPYTTDGQQVTTEGQQVTEVPRITERQQTTERQQVTTKVPQTTEGRQVTTEVPQATEEQQVTETQQVTEVPRVTERQQVTTERQQVTTEVPQTTEEQQVTEDYSNTSLHLAAEQGNLSAVKYFVEKGDDINAENGNGETPLHLAAQNGHLDTVNTLQRKGLV